ncbi:hypothetical protein [Pseudonocardia sp. N23]|uniref:hypothetical protein n=1 Tax=Pseudonocardia sp. N23 TaxID=1987376 RepID=UPI000BFD54F3|nr:hypothetical protein [Pseudonocardia sp. N23]GAY08025.1 hypothetical protein TOK_6218 [Pseudonocardia sp. N23]
MTVEHTGAGTAVPSEVMAVLHVRAPVDVDPHLIAAELSRAVSGHRKHRMTAEIAFARDVLTPSQRGSSRPHGFVAILTFGDGGPPRRLDRRVRKIVRRSLHDRFGTDMSARVRTELSTAEVAAFWCTLRGVPHRPA